jgi:hypothetical protein
MSSETHRRATNAGTAEAGGNVGAAAPRYGIAVQHTSRCNPVVYEPIEMAKAGVVSMQAHSQETSAERDWLQPSALGQGRRHHHCGDVSLGPTRIPCNHHPCGYTRKNIEIHDVREIVFL